jgi:putative Holliday junction resolvase
LNHETSSTQIPEGVFIAFDFGEKRIGVAVGDTSIGLATPLEVVANHHGRPDWDKISQLVEQWQPAGFVVGLPISEDGQTQRALPLSNAFSNHLKKRYARPVFRCDERFSSIEASRVIAENRKRGQRRKSKREDTDKVAAAVILELWFCQRG